MYHGFPLTPEIVVVSHSKYLLFREQTIMKSYIRHMTCLCSAAGSSVWVKNCRHINFKIWGNAAGLQKSQPKLRAGGPMDMTWERFIQLSFCQQQLKRKILVRLLVAWGTGFWWLSRCNVAPAVSCGILLFMGHQHAWSIGGKLHPWEIQSFQLY